MRLKDIIPDNTPLIGSDSERVIQRLIEANPIERVLFLLIVVGGLFFAGWLFTGLVIPGDQLQLRIDFYSIITSSILTIGLIWVYLEFVSQSTQQTDLIERQIRTQDELAEVQKTQTELMEAEYIPDLIARDLNIGNVDFSSSPISSDCHPDDIVELTISNRSEITARNLHLELLIDYPKSTGWEFPILVGYRSPLKRIASDGWSSGEGDSIQSDETEVKFHSCAQLAFELDLGKEPVSVQEGLNDLTDQDINRVRVGMMLVTTDKRGERQNIDLQGWDYKFGGEESQGLGLRQITEGESVEVRFIRDHHLWKGYYRR